MGDATVDPSVCFKVQKIIGVSIGEGNLRNYQVQWAPTWVSGFHLVGCEKLIQEFVKEQSELALPPDEDKLSDRCTDGASEEIDLNESTQFLTHNECSGIKETAGGNNELSSIVHNDYFDHDNLEVEDLSPSDSDTVTDVQVIPGIPDNETSGEENVNPNFEWIENSYCTEKEAGDELESISSTSENSIKTGNIVGQAVDYPTNSVEELPIDTSVSSDVLTASQFPTESNIIEVNDPEKKAVSSYPLGLKEEDDDIILVEPSETNEIHPESISKSQITLQGSQTYIALKTTENSIKSYPLSDNNNNNNSNNNNVNNNNNSNNNSQVVLTSFSFPPRDFKCTTCHVVFTTRAMLAQHCSVFHSQTDGDSGEGGGGGGGGGVGGGGGGGGGTRTANIVYPCPICSETFESKSILRKHKLTHKPELKCNLCEEVFLESRYLMAHLRTHQKGALRCRYCDKVCVSKSILDRHERVHTGERPFRCELCPKAYKRKEDLLLHSKNHRPPGVMYSHM